MIRLPCVLLAVALSAGAGCFVTGHPGMNTRSSTSKALQGTDDREGEHDRGRDHERKDFDDHDRRR